MVHQKIALLKLKPVENSIFVLLSANCQNQKLVVPFNPLDKQLEYNPETREITKWIVPPFNKFDEISAHHVVCYLRGVDKNECYRKIVSELDKIPYGELPKMGMFARKVINNKQKLELGVLEKKFKKLQ